MIEGMKRRSIVLVIVVGVFIVIATFALTASFFMRQQLQLTEHKIRRMRAFYAAKAAMIYALAELGKGNNPDGMVITVNNLDIQVAVNPAGAALPPGTQQVDLTVNY